MWTAACLQLEVHDAQMTSTRAALRELDVTQRALDAILAEIMYQAVHTATALQFREYLKHAATQNQRYVTAHVSPFYRPEAIIKQVQSMRTHYKVSFRTPDKKRPVCSLPCPKPTKTCTESQ